VFPGNTVPLDFCFVYSLDARGDIFSPKVQVKVTDDNNEREHLFNQTAANCKSRYCGVPRTVSPAARTCFKFRSWIQIKTIYPVS
jgi:hypothetical protein